MNSIFFRFSTLLLLAALSLGMSACAPEEQSSGATDREGPFKVITTTGMVADLVRAVGGEHFEVRSLLGEGTDPHEYSPTRRDVVALQEADLIFYNGLMLEGKMTDILVRMARRGQPVYAATEFVEEREDYLLMDEDDDDYFDPHVWMDVQGWILALDVVRDALTEFLPAEEATFRQNADAFRAELEELDHYSREAIASIPEERRVLVTAHDAFQYMSRAYDIEVRGIQGISTETEAGVRDIEDVVRFVTERNIPAIFVETSVSDRNVRAVIEGARAKGHEIQIGGELFSDAMGPEGTYEGTYIGMIDHNVTTIVRSLGGEAPERGMQGRLGGE
ncbi:MAG: zinc ABC transporter substrate-binding protein [Opitutales bacterium]|nr:zinc ABC transporter substrate-binding protein [Opitutales bacterium]MCH8540625.1 zinc ABC transporter substrate-binding protein [Opitutales bacterium]